MHSNESARVTPEPILYIRNPSACVHIDIESAPWPIRSGPYTTTYNGQSISVSVYEPKISTGGKPRRQVRITGQGVNAKHICRWYDDLLDSSEPRLLSLVRNNRNITEVRFDKMRLIRSFDAEFTNEFNDEGDGFVNLLVPLNTDLALTFMIGFHKETDENHVNVEVDDITNEDFCRLCDAVEHDSKLPAHYNSSES